MKKLELVDFLNNPHFRFWTPSFLTRKVSVEVKGLDVIEWLKDVHNDDFIECYFIKPNEIFIGASD